MVHMRSPHSAAAVALVLLAAATLACNTRNPLAELPPIGPSPTTPISPPPLPPPPVSSVFAVNMTPGALYAGESATGTVLLTAAAPSGGLPVTLTSSDLAVSMPSSITIPAGQDSATFAVAATSVQSDRDVIITGSGGGRTASRTLQLWTVLPMFFSFVSDPNEPIGRGAATRLIPPSAQFTAWCFASQVIVTIDSANQFWRTTFAAPRGTRLTTTTYENTAPASTAPEFPETNGPEMSISGNGAGCSGTGRFTVRELELTTNGRVNRFWASFEQRCQGRTEVMKGDVRVISPRPTSATLVCR
jgi:hypothetical protein